MAHNRLAVHPASPPPRYSASEALIDRVDRRILDMPRRLKVRLPPPQNHSALIPVAFNRNASAVIAIVAETSIRPIRSVNTLPALMSPVSQKNILNFHLYLIHTQVMGAPGHTAPPCDLGSHLPFRALFVSPAANLLLPLPLLVPLLVIPAGNLHLPLLLPLLLLLSRREFRLRTPFHHPNSSPKPPPIV